MKYKEYLITTSQVTTAFMNQCVAVAGNTPDAAPYIEECQQAAHDFETNASYEAYDNFADAASNLVEKFLFGAITSPQDLATLNDAANNYSDAARQIADTYLGNKEPEKSLNWLQVQDDGVYVNGDGDATPKTPWPDDIPIKRPRRRRYPERVPLVPPESIPTGTPKVKKISPVTPPTGGCVNKRRPQPGQFCLRSWPYNGNIVELMWWDNIIMRNTWYDKNDFEMHYEEHYSGTPLAMPSAMPPELTADLPKGRYVITQVTQNNAIENPYGIDYYSRYEGWSWELIYPDHPADPPEEWTRSEMRTQGNEWVECLGLKYGDSPHYYHFPGIIGQDAGVMCVGDGHAVGYTLGRMTMRYLGSDFPPVEETPEETPAAAYLATLGAVEALTVNNMCHLLRLGGIRWER